MKTRRTLRHRSVMWKNILGLVLIVFVILSAYLVVDNLFPQPCNNFYRRNPLMLVWINVKPNSKHFFERYERYLAEDIQKYQRKDIFEEIKNLKQSENNIFFIVSTCTTEDNLKSYNSKSFILDARQSCAVESTALANPGSGVYIIHTCPLNDNFKYHLTNVSKKLFEYPNVHIVLTDLRELFLGTPAQQVINNKQKYPPQEFFRDIMSFTVLWKFGGTFFDWDSVNIKSLADLERNSVGVQDGDVQLARVEPAGPGHETMERVVRFMGSRVRSLTGYWAFTQLALRNCQPAEETARVRRCESFNLYNPRVFYPVPRNRAETLFNPKTGWELMEALKRDTYVVHSWRRRSHDSRVRVGSGQGYALLAHQFCPNVYRNCGPDL